MACRWRSWTAIPSATHVRSGLHAVEDAAACRRGARARRRLPLADGFGPPRLHDQPRASRTSRRQQPRQVAGACGRDRRARDRASGRTGPRRRDARRHDARPHREERDHRRRLGRQGPADRGACAGRGTGRMSRRRPRAPSRAALSCSARVRPASRSRSASRGSTCAPRSSRRIRSTPPTIRGTPGCSPRRCAAQASMCAPVSERSVCGRRRVRTAITSSICPMDRASRPRSFSSRSGAPRSPRSGRSGSRRSASRTRAPTR